MGPRAGQGHGRPRGRRARRAGLSAGDAFALLDAGGAGAVAPPALAGACAWLGVDADAEDVLDLVEALDDTGAGALDLRCFAKIFAPDEDGAAPPAALEPEGSAVARRMLEAEGPIAERLHDDLRAAAARRAALRAGLAAPAPPAAEAVARTLRVGGAGAPLAAVGGGAEGPLPAVEGRAVLALEARLSVRVARLPRRAERLAALRVAGAAGECAAVAGGGGRLALEWRAAGAAGVAALGGEARAVLAARLRAGGEEGFSFLAHGAEGEQRALPGRAQGGLYASGARRRAEEAPAAPPAAVTEAEEGAAAVAPAEEEVEVAVLASRADNRLRIAIGGEAAMDVTRPKGLFEALVGGAAVGFFVSEAEEGRGPLAQVTGGEVTVTYV